jgi:hypothetical protein
VEVNFHPISRQQRDKYTIKDYCFIGKNTFFTSINFSLAVSSVRMRRFSDISKTNSFPIFRVCWWFGCTKTDESSVSSSGCAGGLVAPILMSHQFYLQGVLVVW